jgi:hypothetical protein
LARLLLLAQLATGWQLQMCSWAVGYPQAAPNALHFGIRPSPLSASAHVSSFLASCNLAEITFRGPFLWYEDVARLFFSSVCRLTASFKVLSVRLRYRSPLSTTHCLSTLVTFPFQARQANSDLVSQCSDMELKLATMREIREEERFYFPHTLDFRGRAYPLHPYLNHLGSDVCRGLLMVRIGPYFYRAE